MCECIDQCITNQCDLCRCQAEGQDWTDVGGHMSPCGDTSVGKLCDVWGMDSGPL